MEDQTIKSDLIVAEVMARWPNTIPVFLKYQMDCIGCEMAPFETLYSAARIYNLPFDLFLKDLQLAASKEEFDSKTC